MHARSLLLSLGFVAAPLAAQAPADTTVPRTLAPASQQVTLAEAIRRAQISLPAMVQARGQARSAGVQKRSAYGAYLPNVTLNGNMGGSNGESRVDVYDSVSKQVNPVVVTRTSRNIGTSLNASIDLFTGLRRGADLSAAKATERSADAGLVNARFQTRLQVTQAYLDALAGRQTVDVRIASVRRAQEQLKVSVAKLRAGSATRSDSLRSEVNLGNARVALINAEIAQATAEASLGRLIGTDARVEAADDSTYYHPAPVDTAGIRAEALSRSPQVTSADASAAAAHAQVRSAYSAYSPSLTLSGTYSMSDNPPSFSEAELLKNRSVSLGLSWPLFNRFQREQTVATRQIAADNADATAADARRQVGAGVTQQLATLAAAQTRIEITSASVQAATEDLRVVSERYRLGAATIVDLLTSQEALTQAEVDAVNARFDYLRAKAQIEALIGRAL